MPVHDADAGAGLPEAPDARTRMVALAVNLVVFLTLYFATALAAAQTAVSRSIVTPADHWVPFVPWMLVPYAASAPLLLIGFLTVRDRQTLRALSQRCLLATVVATLVFALWPLRVSFTRPEPATPALVLLHRMLTVIDSPFNQFPSLHVAYCLILWPALSPLARSRGGLVGIAVLLMLVALSAVFTWQHHLLDVLGGVALGAFAWWRVPAWRAGPWVTLHYALLAMAALTLGLTVLPWSVMLWCAVCCTAVAVAYAREDADFLHKRDGRFPWWVWLVYGPYLAGYFVAWWLVRWRERAAAPVTRVVDRLWIGRRLTRAELRALPSDCSVIDLAAELPQLAALRARTSATIGLLDLAPVPLPRMQAALDAIDGARARGAPVFVHCSMGYHRSRAVARAWCARHGVRSPL